jgi:hypothetical protein
MHQLVLKHFLKNLLGLIHGVAIVHLSFLDHGFGHESPDVGEAA